MNDEPQPLRTLTDADVDLIADKTVARLRAEMTRQFYDDLGRGLWKAIKVALFALLLGLAAWGAKIELPPVETVHK
jgi:hypothetical protein